jgi:hypothetical protein
VNLLKCKHQLIQVILRGFLHVEVPKEKMGHFINSELQNTIADLAEIAKFLGLTTTVDPDAIQVSECVISICCTIPNADPFISRESVHSILLMYRILFQCLLA